MKQNLSEYIVNDLRAKMLAGVALPAKLTLPALSRHYGVSPMPVRTALQELLAEKLLLKLENGRFAPASAADAGTMNRNSLSPDGIRQSPPRAMPPTDWLEALTNHVAGLSLRGTEMELPIAPIAEKFSISRSLVHTVFHRLAGIGLLEHLPRRGWSVRPFRERDLESYLQVRQSLEVLALELARDRLEPRELRRLLELNQPTEPARIDNSLHAYWVERSENRYVLDFFQRHHAYFSALVTHTTVKRKDVDESREGHRRILEALLRQDWNAARDELIVDIQRLRPLLQATIKRLSSGEESEPTREVRTQGLVVAL